VLTHYLQVANRLLGDLITTTQHDLEDVKNAQHSNLFARTPIKDELIKSFENHQSLINNEIAKLMSQAPNKSLDVILDDEQHTLLDKMKISLKELQSVNKHLATMVIAVSEFYNSLLGRLIPTEQVGYEGHKAKYASFLQIKG
jgi:hypothetical protein